MKIKNFSLFQKPILLGLMSSDFKKVTDSLASLLEYKDKQYGSAYKDTESIFGEGISPEIHLYTRLNEKLNRIKNSNELRKNDVVDLTSYLVLLLKTRGWDNFDEFKD